MSGWRISTLCTQACSCTGIANCCPASGARSAAIALSGRRRRYHPQSFPRLGGGGKGARQDRHAQRRFLLIGLGDQSDLVVFSIMVEGLHHRAVNSVRGAQVSAVNAMMRYARGTLGPAPAEEAMPTQDLETGGESAELEGEADLPETAPTEKSGKDMDQMLKDFGGPGNEP